MTALISSFQIRRQFIQLAKHWGIKTINIVRREKYKDELKALGADEVINSETEGSLIMFRHFDVHSL